MLFDLLIFYSFMEDAILYSFQKENLFLHLGSVCQYFGPFVTNSCDSFLGLSQMSIHFIPVMLIPVIIGYNSERVATL